MTIRTLLPALLLLALALPAAAQTTYRIDPSASRIVYAMEHPAHDWTGTSRRVSGTLQVQDGQILRGRVAAPVVSFDSGNRSRDSNMASDTEAYLYPDVVFEATRVQYGTTGQAQVEGRLTFHGVSRSVTMPATVDVKGDHVQIRGHFEVTLTEFGIERPSLMMVRTRDWIGLDVDLVARAS